MNEAILQCNSPDYIDFHCENDTGFSRSIGYSLNFFKRKILNLLSLLLNSLLNEKKKNSDIK